MIESSEVERGAFIPVRRAPKGSSRVTTGAVTIEVGGVISGPETFISPKLVTVVGWFAFLIETTCVANTATNTVSTRAIARARNVITFRFLNAIRLLSSAVLNTPRTFEILPINSMGRNAPLVGI